MGACHDTGRDILAAASSGVLLGPAPHGPPRRRRVLGAGRRPDRHRQPGPLGAAVGRDHRGHAGALDRARPGVAAQAVGLAQGALDLAVQYTHERQQFGQSISSFQGVQWMLADMKVKIDAARLLIYRAVINGEQGFPSRLEAATAKVFSNEMAVEVTNAALQIFGGYGYCKDYPAERHLRDARITEIYEGTSEVQRLVIARSVLSG